MTLDSGCSPDFDPATPVGIAFLHLRFERPVQKMDVSYVLTRRVFATRISH